MEAIPTPSFTIEDFRLRVPSCILVAAPSFGGKTHFTLDLIKLRYEAFKQRIDNVVYYSCTTPTEVENYSKLDKNFHIVNSVEEAEEYLKVSGPSIYVLDDILTIIVQEKKFLEYVQYLFICRSHHENLVVTLLIQNLFPIPRFRTISLNATYIGKFPQLYT